MIPGVALLAGGTGQSADGMLFTLSADGYEREAVFISPIWSFYFYCLASLSMTVIHRKQIERTVYSILAAFPLAVFVIFIQQIYPEIILTGSAATCAMLITYLHLQNRQISRDYLTNVPNRQELLDMMGLLIKKHPEKQLHWPWYRFGSSGRLTMSAVSTKEMNLRKICGYLL